MLSPRSATRCFAIAGCSAALWLLAAAHPAGAAFPGANGRIVFDRFTTQPTADTSQIWSVNADGSGQLDLTNTSGTDESASWSPDGSKIAFDRFDPVLNNDQVWVMKADGSGQVNVTNDPASFDGTPAWSPDGTKIVYSHSDPATGDLEIWVMNADGSGKHDVIAPVPGGSDNQASWSPDGSRIAFTRTTSTGSQIWVANADGSGAQNVSSDADSDTDPNWSPDGTKLVFGKIPASSQSGDSQIWVMNADGSGAHAITAPDSANDTPGSHQDSNPVWSPDGTQIAYERQTGALDTNPFQTSIWVVRADGTVAHQVSSPAQTQSDFRPDWQPVGTPVSAAALPSTCTTSGNVVVHVSDPSGLRSTLVVVYKIDTGGVRLALADPAGDATIVVPNGKHILQYWGADSAGNQEAQHHAGGLTIDTLTGCVPAKISVAGVRRACVTSRFSVRVHISTHAKPRSIRVFLGKKRVVTTRRTAFRLSINPRKLARHTRLRIIATDASGHVTTINRTIARCAIAKPRPVAPRFTG